MCFKVYENLIIRIVYDCPKLCNGAKVLTFKSKNDKQISEPKNNEKATLPIETNTAKKVGGIFAGLSTLSLIKEGLIYHKQAGSTPDFLTFLIIIKP